MALNFSWMTEHPVLLIRPRFLGGGIGEEQGYKDAIRLLMECHIILLVA